MISKPFKSENEEINKIIDWTIKNFQPTNTQYQHKVYDSSRNMLENELRLRESEESLEIVTKKNGTIRAVRFDNFDSISLVASEEVDMQTAGLTVLFSVPSGYYFYPCFLIVRDQNDSMAGGTDYDFGTGASANTWRQAIDLSSMTTAGTDYMVIRGADVTKYTRCDGGDQFGVYVNTGSTAATTAIIDVYGFLTR